MSPNQLGTLMKRILFALTIVGLLLPLAPRAQAETEVSVNFFYDNLSAQGTWMEVGDYGYCFQPNVAVNNPNWRPYADGYWAYTDAGWTWVSYEDFGWATYHYGRWSRLADYGWVWVPGYEWAPAWVSWRTGGDYVGWAPLPPTVDRVYEGRAITGQVDVEFDIGPLYYNFVDVRYIGEPVLRARIFEPQRNVTIINRTVNVTNITYNNSTVYNYGPDYNRLNQYSTRPIQRLSLQRQTTVGAGLTAQGGRGATFNRVNGNQLMVVAPPIQHSEQKFAPKQVKAKVTQPKVEHGWQGVADRAKLQDEMKKENAQNVPPPSFQPQKGRKREAVGAAQELGANQAAGAGEPSAGQAAPANQVEAGQPAKGARKGKKNAPGQPPGSQQGNQPALTENATVDQAQEQGNHKRGHKAEEPKAQPDQDTKAQQAEKTDQPQPGAKHTPPTGAQQAEGAQRAGQAQESNNAQPNNATSPGAPAHHAKRPQQAHPAEQAQQPQPDGVPGNQEPVHQAKGKKKKPAAEPT